MLEAEHPLAEAPRDRTPVGFGTGRPQVLEAPMVCEPVPWMNTSIGPAAAACSSRGSPATQRSEADSVSPRHR